MKIMKKNFIGREKMFGGDFFIKENIITNALIYLMM